MLSLDCFAFCTLLFVVYINSVENKPIDQLVTGASSIAWGAWTDSHKAQGFWNRRVAYASSNYRDLSNNITVVAFVNKFGGTSTKLDCLTRLSSHGHGQSNNTASGLFIRTRELESGPVVKNDFHVEWLLHPNLF